jgi:hypothetical protein
MRLDARAQQCRHVTTATMTCKRHAWHWCGGGGGKVMISLHQQQM